MLTAIVLDWPGSIRMASIEACLTCSISEQLTLGADRALTSLFSHLVAGVVLVFTIRFVCVINRVGHMIYGCLP